MDRTSDENLREGVRQAYSRAAEDPTAKRAFPIGKGFAASVGYPLDLLNELAQEASEAFAGVSNIAINAAIPESSHVLDLGCGAGLDSLIAVQRTGPGGEVIGVDFSETMLTLARRGAAKKAWSNLRFLRGDAEAIPLPSGWADVVLANGIFNLNPARARIFKELARVTKKGGAVYAAELILRGPFPDEVKAKPSNWFA